MAKSKTKQITIDAIRQKAQKIYEERMNTGTEGSPEKDWSLAEKELGVK